MTDDAGIPHVDDTAPNDFAGTDTAGDVGEPGNLGADVGTPAAPEE